LSWQKKKAKKQKDVLNMGKTEVSYGSSIKMA
jgi:hypothetical protein